MTQQQIDGIQARYLFRAWDAAYHKMIYSGVDRNHKLAIGMDGKIYGFEYDEANTDGDNNCVGVYPERFLIMQCTGLRDKNGTLIFEGDIVRMITVYSSMTDVSVGPVRYTPTMYYVETEYRKPLLKGHKDASTYEVLGNIHDNPELLETEAHP